MSSPFMQFYIGDYLRDTAGLTTEEHGAYLLIMFAMWNADGWVSAEPRKMAQFARMTPARWAKIAPDIMPYFTIDDGLATQGRLLKQLEKASGKSLKRSEAGKRGAQAKALKSLNQAQAIATANAQAIGDDLPKHLPDTRNQIPKKEEEEFTAAGAPAASKPVSVSRETFRPEQIEIPSFLLRAQPQAVGGEIVPVVFDPLARAVEAYNAAAAAAGWAKCQRLTTSRQRSLKARLAECDGLAGWQEAMDRAGRSSFLTGKTGRGGDHAQWRPDFDFFLQIKSFTKLMEGGYDDAPGNTNGGSQLDRIAEAARYASAQGDPDQRTA